MPSRRLIRDLNTLIDFELFILDARVVEWDSDDGYVIVPLSWPCFSTYVKGVEFDLGPGVLDTYDGHCCILFHPLKREIQQRNPMLPHKRKRRVTSVTSG